MAGKVHAIAGEDLFLAVQGQGVGVLGHHDVGQQRTVGDGFGEDLRGARGDDDTLRAFRPLGVAWGVLGAQGTDDVGLAGDDGQLFGGVVANQPIVRAQGLLVFGGEINDPIDSRQMLWQGLAHQLGFGRWRQVLGGWLDEGGEW